jgi:hypothetical protein
LEALENRKKGDQEKDNQRPSLQRKTHPAEDENQDSDDPNKDDRPTSKRRVS